MKMLFAFTLLCVVLSAVKADQNSFDFITSGDTVDTYWYRSRSGPVYKAKLSKNRLPSDYTHQGFVKQPSTIEKKPCRFPEVNNREMITSDISLFHNL